MTRIIMEGKTLAQSVLSEIKEKVATLSNKPGLAIIQVGENPASTIYVNKKIREATKCGFFARLYKVDENIEQDKLIHLIHSINAEPNIHGFIIQKPIPKHIDEFFVDNAIDPKKDVDGFCSDNQAALFKGRHGFVPATPKGVIRLLDHYKVPIKGKHVVVVGRSLIVGKPLSMLFLNRDATVTVCHSKTDDLKNITRTADILCVAIGQPLLIGKEHVKKGAVVIDIGINRDKGSHEMDSDAGKIVGDVDFEDVKDIAGMMTPVPGGVGQMTVAMLLENTLNAYLLQQLKSSKPKLHSISK